MYAYLVAVEVLEDVEVTRVVWVVVVVALFVDGPDCEELDDITVDVEAVDVETADVETVNVETVDKGRVEVEVNEELAETTELLVLEVPV